MGRASPADGVLQPFIGERTHHCAGIPSSILLLYRMRQDLNRLDDQCALYTQRISAAKLSARETGQCLHSVSPIPLSRLHCELSP